ncbi:hypothetical protein FGO68_gene804 [Halteria grandinella]|uniref:FAD/NAD(P)-binding domain-containing protein n=1 Tax=Halteria grandinella TaxID=5974 RepID=A0A8J8NQP3_HALGN|nr:hypothetical protein FGO68_gene804 [Halteria grandinella]
MGTKQGKQEQVGSQRHLIGPKQIVIVGASFAGLFLAKKLIKLHSKIPLQITFLDKNSYFELITSLPGALLSPEHASRIILPYTQIMAQLTSCSPHVSVQFIQGMLTRVTAGGSDSIEYSIENGQVRYLRYDYLVLATGSMYSQPIKHYYAFSQEDRLEGLKAKRESIKGKSVLVVGGGSNGVEIASEMAESGGCRRVGLATRGQRLLGGLPERCHLAADRWMRENGVEVHYNTTYQEDTKDTLAYDEVIDCTGFKYTSSGGPSSYLQGDLSSCISPQTGQILVNSYLQLSSPSQSFSNIFSLGDVCLTPSNEEKAIVPIHILSSFLSANLHSLITNNGSNLQPIPAVIPRVYMINFGTRGAGVVVFNEFVMEGMDRVPVLRHVVSVKKFKRMIDWLNLGELQGHKCERCIMSAQYTGMDAAFCLFRQQCLKCLPCHVDRVDRRKSVKDAIKRVKKYDTLQ